eukprot:TRINITY_DN8639_c0_g1_i1.p1 TRINITY_DN8639_c0_g1~~TRINITY_DN8639_c0_g1_i1.p1  ORF type:complete len:118 (-),score=28.64 TRINITY_DN8639_c0_g1_i1:65-418(-)
MLKPKVLPQLLQQANTNGVKATSLLTTDGSLLASSGDNGKVISAIFANIWTSYEKSQVGNLEYLLSECEEGKICVTKVTNQFLLCIYGDLTSEFGMLKLKAKLLKEYLEEPLKQIMD